MDNQTQCCHKLAHLREKRESHLTPMRRLAPLYSIQSDNEESQTISETKTVWVGKQSGQSI